MGLNWNFQRGGGFKPKKTCHGGIMDIFWNSTFLEFDLVFGSKHVLVMPKMSHNINWI